MLLAPALYYLPLDLRLLLVLQLARQEGTEACACKRTGKHNSARVFSTWGDGVS